MDQFLGFIKSFDTQSATFEFQISPEQSIALDALASALLSCCKHSSTAERGSTSILNGLRIVQQIAQYVNHPLQKPASTGGWICSSQLSSPVGRMFSLKTTSPTMLELGFQLDSRQQIYGDFYLEQGEGDEALMCMFELIQQKGLWSLRRRDVEDETCVPLDLSEGDIPWKPSPDLNFLDSFFTQIDINGAIGSIFGPSSSQQQEPGQAQMNGLQCPQCGSVSTPGKRFCRHCGSPLPVDATTAPLASSAPSTCPQCSNPLRPESKFCSKCGYKTG